MIRSTPASAQVVVNGEAWPLGGTTKQVPAGKYTVRVSADGCDAQTVIVTVEEGQTARKAVTLTCQQP